MDIRKSRIEDLPRRADPWVTHEDVKEAEQIVADADKEASAQLHGETPPPPETKK